MKIVLLTALGVGGATVFGALIGFAFKKVSHKFSDVVLGFAAGVMLAAAVIGLILPSLESGDNFAPVVTISGVMVGALFLNIIDKMVPHLHNTNGVDAEKHPELEKRINRIMLFVLAIAIHNLPEGIAAADQIREGCCGVAGANAADFLQGIQLQGIQVVIIFNCHGHPPDQLLKLLIVVSISSEVCTIFSAML